MPANSYYTATANPATNALAASATMRNEFQLIQSAFGLLPTLGAGVANQIVVVNSGGTALTTSAASSITAGLATAIAGGAAGEVPYQSAAGVTGFSAAGSSGQVLTSGGTGAPAWGAMTCNSSGNVNIPSPSSGTALTVLGLTTIGAAAGAVWLNVKQTTTTSTDFATVAIERDTSHTGGSGSNVNSAIHVALTTGAGTSDNEWAGTFIIYNYATAGSNVALYAQGNKYSGAYITWAAVSEAHDRSGSANPTTGLVSHEFDMFADGADNNLQRVNIDVVGGIGVSVAPTIGYGIRIGPQNGVAANCTFVNGIYIYGNATTPLKISATGTNGVDMSGATLSGVGLKMAQGQAVAFDASSTNQLLWNGTTLAYTNGGTSIMTVNPSTLQWALINSTQQAQIQVSSSGTFFWGANKDVLVGTSTSNNLRFLINSSEKARIDTNANFVTNSTGSALATSATAGFTYLPSCAGPPTGTPATSYTGSIPTVFDSNAGLLYGYANGAWYPAAGVLPPNTQTGNYTLVMGDIGRTIDCNNSGAQTITIPANSSVAFPIGACITIENRGTTAVSIAITTDTLYQAGTTNTGTRTLSINHGQATIKKQTATTWVISGSGIT